MHALHTPMAARAVGDALNFAGGGADVVSGVETASIVEFGAGRDFDDGLDVGKPRLSRIASVARDPIDNAGSRVSACFDASVAFFDGGWETVSAAGAVRK